MTTSDRTASMELIWRNLKETEARSLYYKERARQLDNRYRRITFGIALIPLVALALFQSGLPHTDWIVPVLLSIAGFAQFSSIHFEWGGDVLAAKIKANQTAELAQQWQWLWFNKKRNDVTRWMTMLKEQGDELEKESIPERKDVRDEMKKKVNEDFRKYGYVPKPDRGGRGQQHQLTLASEKTSESGVEPAAGDDTFAAG